MLRISRVDGRSTGTLLIVEGSLAGPWVGELKAAVLALANARGGVTLDLRAVHFADAQGTRLLLRLLKQGVLIGAMSPFVAELMRLEPGD